MKKGATGKMSRASAAIDVPPKADERALAQHTAMLLAAIIHADGTVNGDEVALARQACEEFGIPLELLDAALGSAMADPMESFVATLMRVEHPADRERLASILFEIASVDEKLDDREVRMLRAMQQVWGVSVSFLNKPIEWDDDQLRVIEADRSARLLVSAGPGMGKTAVACSRVAHLVEFDDVADTNVWLVSFTRSAIAELKGRIGDFAEDPSNVFAVKISTIDSQAWKIRYGFSPEEVEKLFGGFETGIDAATELIDARMDDFRDIFGDLEHLIVDEAQDITGGRARFLLKLIDLLPKDCGITVFHDPAQAIYDYAAGEELFRFTDGLAALLGEDLQRRSLKKIYRTDEAPLLKLYEDLRLDILGNADVGADSFQSKTDLVKSAAVSQGKGFDHDALDGYDDALVLFRKRMEVAQASAFMAGDGHRHRLRMSGLGRFALPWLALVLGKTETRELERAEFAERSAEARDRFPPLLFGEDIEGNSVEARWDRLSRYAGMRGDRIDLFKLRSRLAGAPPDEFMAPEFGHTGPILGTIHASKGREADHVFLQINDNWGARSGADEKDLSEEARVLFVGATRAKRSLAVQGGFAMKFASTTESGRCYRKMPKYKNGYQFQLGLQGDFDAYSPLKLAKSLDTATAEDLPLRCRARLEPGTWLWRVETETGVPLGTLSKRVTNDLYEISNKYHGSGRRLNDQIRNIFLMGFGSMIAAPGDERLNGAKQNGATSGFWLVPQLCGLPLVFV